MTTETLKHGKNLADKRFYSAALELWESILLDKPSSNVEYGSLYDEMGKAFVQLGDIHNSLQFFRHAIRDASDASNLVQYQMHLALAHQKLAEYDTALRILTQIREEHLNELGPGLRAAVHANLAVVQGSNGFYRESLENTQKAIYYFESDNNLSNHPMLYNNLGVAYLDLGQHAEANGALTKAFEMSDGSYLSPISELCRLYISEGDIRESMRYARMALPLVWSSVMNYQKNEVARLSRMLAQLAYYTGERQLALRLIEKSQLFFGQLGMWREWQEVQSVMDQWEETPMDSPFLGVESEDNPRLQQFARLLDALNAQELIHESFSQLIDLRVLYVRAFARHMRLTKEEQEALVYAARFMDTGLTSIEPDVVANPSRSAQALAQYQLHPQLSIDMLQMAELSDFVLAIIADHHEWVDGSGFPAHKSGLNLPRLPQMLAIVDEYTSALVFDRLQHSHALARCRELAGYKYDKALFDGFSAMFQVQ